MKYLLLSLILFGCQKNHKKLPIWVGLNGQTLQFDSTYIKYTRLNPFCSFEGTYQTLSQGIALSVENTCTEAKPQILYCYLESRQEYVVFTCQEIGIASNFYPQNN